MVCPSPNGARTMFHGFERVAGISISYTAALSPLAAPTMMRLLSGHQQAHEKSATTGSVWLSVTDVTHPGWAWLTSMYCRRRLPPQLSAKITRLRLGTWNMMPVSALSPLLARQLELVPVT